MKKNLLITSVLSMFFVMIFSSCFIINPPENTKKINIENNSNYAFTLYNIENADPKSVHLNPGEKVEVKLLNDETKIKGKITFDDKSLTEPIDFYIKKITKGDTLYFMNNNQ